MTLHYVLSTIDGGFVWATETAAFLSQAGRTNGVEKIIYVPELKIAYGPWGDVLSLRIGDSFAKLVKAGLVNLKDPAAVRVELSNVADSLLPENEKGKLPLHQDSRGLILITLDGQPRCYQLTATWPPCTLQVPHLKGIVAGDISNSARLFIDTYYQLSGKSTDEVIALAVHAMRLATEANPGILGAPNVWVYQAGDFRPLTLEEMAKYSSRSQSLDESILKHLRGGAV
jgi:hypothetical protein